jgi:hypothetical protein
MNQAAFERGDWQAVIDAHRLESHDAAEWLRYGSALLHSLAPGPEIEVVWPFLTAPIVNL